MLVDVVPFELLFLFGALSLLLRHFQLALVARHAAAILWRTRTLAVHECDAVLFPFLVGADADHADFMPPAVADSVQVMLFKDRLEVWNPGKLPQGMSIAKLNKEHTSNPVNPVLANPVYLSGYIEQMGTGTTDIIDHCLDYGLRKPEFHQDDDFRVVLWRPEVKERGEETGEVDDKMKRIILTIRGNTVSSAEIMKKMNLTGLDSFRKRYLIPSIEKGYVAQLYPDAPKRRDQAYYLTEKGLALYAEISKEN